MDLAKLQGLGIRNLRTVFGRGARGETLARGCHIGRTLEVVKEAGVNVVIDLRTADHNDKLHRRCDDVGLRYQHLPVDARSIPSDDMAVTLPALFRYLDEGGFYLSCQQGLHRTDIALALYFFFHDDRDIPEMFGHRMKGFLRCDDIMRRINSLRQIFTEIDEKLFEDRRRRFLEFNRTF